jgi:hypothetical protein
MVTGIRPHIETALMYGLAAAAVLLPLGAPLAAHAIYSKPGATPHGAAKVFFYCRLR